MKREVNKDFLICPYCKFASVPEGNNVNENTQKWQCIKCNKEFDYWADISIYYHTQSQ